MGLGLLQGPVVGGGQALAHPPLWAQERAGVKMILIQDGSQNTNVDKPLRVIGDPYKVQVGAAESPRTALRLGFSVAASH